MTDRLIPFLREVVGRTMPFASLITHLHVKETKKGTLLVKGVAHDGTIIITATSIDQINIDGARACLGNLPYLNSVLTSESVRTASAEAELTVSEINGKPLLTMIKIVPNKRMEFNYTTTNPFRASITKPLEISIPEWPIIMVFDKDTLKELGEFRKIHATAPNSGSEDILTLVYANEAASIDFGEGGEHTASLELNIATSSEDSKPLSITLLTDQFLKAMTQSKDEEGIVELYMADKAVMLRSETPLAQYDIVLPKRIRRAT